MTAKELAQRLAKFTTKGSLDGMDAGDRLTILDAINCAVFNWFSLVPERYKITTISHLIREPSTQTVTMVNGSNVVSGMVAEDYMLGASIQIGSEVNMNEIISVADGVATLLNDFRGETGAHSSTIYFDTIMLTDYLVGRITSHPRILDTGITLTRDDDGMKNIGAERRGAGVGLGGIGAHYGSSFSRQLGSPYRYTVEDTGISQLDEARIMLRLDPLPVAEATVQFSAAIDASSLDLRHLEGDTAIPIPNQYIIPHILPMAKSAIAESDIWANEQTRQLAIQAGDAGIIFPKIQQSVPNVSATPRGKVRTRKGW